MHSPNRIITKLYEQTLKVKSLKWGTAIRGLVSFQILQQAEKSLQIVIACSEKQLVTTPEKSESERRIGYGAL